MKKIRKCCVIVLLVVLFPANIFAQERRDKEQTYVLENPYEVNKITPLQGKKIKNVVLMIGDGMSLMHVYSAWTANRGKLFLDNCQAVGLSKTYCANKLITDSRRRPPRLLASAGRTGNALCQRRFACRCPTDTCSWGAS